VAYPVFKLFAPTKIINRKNFLRGEATIIAGNHQSAIDPLLIAIGFRIRPAFLAKHTLFRTRFKAWFFKHVNAIPVDRNEVGLSVIKRCLAELKAGRKLILFPEGTRRISLEESSSLKGGAALFALKAGVYIQPIHYIGKPGFWRRNKLVIGKPFKLTEFEGQKPTKEVIEAAGKIIGQKIIEVREEYLASIWR